MKSDWSQDLADQKAYIAVTERGIRMNDFKFWHGQEGRRMHVELAPGGERYESEGLDERFAVPPVAEEHVWLNEVLMEIVKTLGAKSAENFLRVCEGESLSGAERTLLSRHRAKLRAWAEENG